MSKRQSTEGYRQALDGIVQKPPVHGDSTLMVGFRLDRDAVLFLHSHPHEQTGYLVADHIRLPIGPAVHGMLRGDS